MAEQLERTVKRISAKSLVLAERMAAERDARAEAERERDRLRSELGRLAADNELLRAQLLSLRLAAVVAPAKEDRRRLQTLLSDLIRQIDKCINDLTH